MQNTIKIDDEEGKINKITMSNETVNILEKKRQRRRLLIANEPPEQKKLRLQKRREMAKIKRDKIIFNGRKTVTTSNKVRKEQHQTR